MRVNLPDTFEAGQYQAVDHAAGRQQDADHFERSIIVLAPFCKAVRASKSCSEREARLRGDIGTDDDLERARPIPASSQLCVVQITICQRGPNDAKRLKTIAERHRHGTFDDSGHSDPVGLGLRNIAGRNIDLIQRR